MYKNCKTDQSAERQKTFYNTLISMMEEQQYKDITVTSLCIEMQIPRKAFYRYFDSLEDVLYAAIDNANDQAFLYLDATADVESFFLYWKENRYFLDVLEKNGLSSLMMNRIYERLNEWLENNKYSNNRIENMDFKYSGYVSAIMSILISWHHSGMKQTPKEMCNLIWEMFRCDW